MTNLRDVDELNQLISDMTETIQDHRKRDELVVAALKLELERGCATGGGVGLAARVLAIYERCRCDYPVRLRRPVQLPARLR